MDFTPSERILAMGIEAAGKSELWIDLLLHTDVDFYIIDTDGSARYSIHELGQQHNLEDVWKRAHVWTCEDPYGALENPAMARSQHGTQWEAITQATKDIRAKKPKPGSWIVIDRVDAMYEATQYYWIAKGYSTTIEKYYSELKVEQEAAEKGTKRDYGGFIGKDDWIPIKRLYKDVLKALLATPAVNKFAVTIAKEPFAMSEKEKQRAVVYGGMIPQGEANLGHDFMTTIEVVQKDNGDRNLFLRRTKSRVKDVERAANGNPRPTVITVDGQPAFYQKWYKEVWKGVG